MSTDRRTLHTTIHDIVSYALNRPKYHAADQLADELTVTVRQAQHDAWTRGFAAGRLDGFDRGPAVQHRSPYNGGRHAGPPAPAWDFMGRNRVAVRNEADTNNAVAIRVTDTAGFLVDPGPVRYAQTNPNPEGK